MASDQNLIQNGDFATNNCPTYCVSNDASTIAPWKISSASRSFQNNKFEIANPGTFPGVNAISMNLYIDVILSRSVATVSEKDYKLSFSVNVNDKCGEKTASGNAFINGVSIEIVAYSTTQVRSTEFTAYGPRTIIYIRSLEIGTCRPVVSGLN